MAKSKTCKYCKKTCETVYVPTQDGKKALCKECRQKVEDGKYTCDTCYREYGYGYFKASSGSVLYKRCVYCDHVKDTQGINFQSCSGCKISKHITKYDLGVKKAIKKKCMECESKKDDKIIVKPQNNIKIHDVDTEVVKYYAHKVAQLKSNYKNSNHEIHVEHTDLIDIYLSQKSLCYYCEKDLNIMRTTISKKLKNENYTKDNIVLGCEPCKHDVLLVSGHFNKLRNEDGESFNKIIGVLSEVLNFKKICTNIEDNTYDIIKNSGFETFASMAKKPHKFDIDELDKKFTQVSKDSNKYDLSSLE